MPAIESPANPLIREIARSLEERTHFLLEGEKAILDAVAAGIRARARAARRERAARAARRADRGASAPGLARRARAARRLAHAAAPARRRAPPRRSRRRDPRRREGPVVFVFGIQDPGNLGAIVRVAEAAGARRRPRRARAPRTSSIPRAVRASAGSVLRIPVSGRVSFEPFAADAKAAGRADLRRRSPPAARTRSRRRSTRARCWSIGAEGTGLPAGAYRYLDRRLTIPMRAPVDSLNAAVAAALLLYSPACAALRRFGSSRRLDCPADAAPRSSSAGSRSPSFREHLRPERPDADVRHPATPRAASPALRETSARNRSRVEAPLRRDLRQEQAPPAARSRGSGRRGRSRSPRALERLAARVSTEISISQPGSSSAVEGRKARVFERGAQRVLRRSRASGRRRARASRCSRAARPPGASVTKSPRGSPERFRAVRGEARRRLAAKVRLQRPARQRQQVRARLRPRARRRPLTGRPRAPPPAERGAPPESRAIASPSDSQLALEEVIGSGNHDDRAAAPCEEALAARRAARRRRSRRRRRATGTVGTRRACRPDSVASGRPSADEGRDARIARARPSAPPPSRTRTRPRPAAGPPRALAPRPAPRGSRRPPRVPRRSGPAESPTPRKLKRSVA